jgi:hypothetical protein
MVREPAHSAQPTPLQTIAKPHREVKHTARRVDWLNDSVALGTTATLSLNH